MKPSTVFGTVLAVSVAAAASTSLMLAPESDAGQLAASPAVGPADAATEARIAELTAQNVELQATLAELRERMEARAASTGERTPVVDDNRIEDGVARMLAERDADAADELAPIADEVDVAALVRSLLDRDLDPRERARIWKLLRESGRIDEVVAEFERRADAAPYDTWAHTELGWACFQRMLASESGPERGKWGAQGGAALAHALEVDETNWDARFTLGEHYTYAGMRGDAVREFETLIEQQADRAPEAKHAQAYLWLGNLHMDYGHPDTAKDVWLQGLALFPNDPALKARLAAFD